MIGLPKSTEFNKRIPKQKFYDNAAVPPKLKKAFSEQIKIIYWKNKIAATTVNLAEGQAVTEIEVFEIRLYTREFDVDILKLIDKEIPYHILYLMEYEGKYQAWISYKVAALSSSNALKVNKYYHTDWLDKEDINIEIEGLDIDTVYENFVRQIAGDSLEKNNSESLDDSFKREEAKQELLKKIKSLQSKIRKEKQFNKQIEMNTELRKKKKELENLK